MQTLILVLIATLSFSVLCLASFCYFLNKDIRNLNEQLIDARREYRCHQEWVKTKLFEYRKKRSQQSGNGSDDTCHKCPIFD